MKPIPKVKRGETSLKKRAVDPDCGRLIWKYATLLMLLILVGIFASRMLDCLDCCKCVLQYTIPAMPADIAKPFSEKVYWQENGLVDHFMAMPASARRYFILHGTGCVIYCILTVVAGLTLCKTMFCRQLKNCA